MKFFLAIAFVTIVIVAAVNADNIGFTDAHIKQFTEECRAEFFIPDKEFEMFKNGETFDADDTVKCFANCFQEKAGILKDGVFQEDTVLAKFTPFVGEEKTKVIIEACKDVSGSEKCETAYKMHQCFKKNYGS